MTLQIRTAAGLVAATVVDGVVDAPGVRYGHLDREASGSAACLPAGEGRAAQSAPAVFPQAPGLLDTLQGPAAAQAPQSDDAFTLRIQAPADHLLGEQDAGDAGVPVLLFVHGGGFTTGGGELHWYDAPVLVREGRLLLVTVSYRLGAAALSDAAHEGGPGSLAWADLLAACSWVRDNIAAFGGDASRITVAGDSAGAWFAHALSASPATRGWFARSLFVSAPRMAPLSHTDDVHRRELLAAAFADGQELLDAQRSVSMAYRGEGFAFAPAVQDDLPAWLGEPRVSGARLHTEAVLTLTTATEASAFLRHLPEETFTPEWLRQMTTLRFDDPAAALASVEHLGGYDAAVALQTRWQFESWALEVVAAAAEAGVSARAMRLDLVSGLERAGTPHCFTLPFLFGSLDAWRDAPMLAGVDEATFNRVRDVVQAAVAAHVHGSPTAVPEFSAQQRTWLVVDGDGARREETP